MKIGILGAGQLGRMLALAGYPLDLEFTFLDPATDACAAPLGTHLHADYEDESALARFCEQIDVATYEFENVPAFTAGFVGGLKPLMPHPRALIAGQDRCSEKQLFTSLGIPVAGNTSVDSLDQLRAAARDIGMPGIVKTRRFGYDGKGQKIIRGEADVAAAWESLGSRPLIYEAFVDFQREVSMIGVRAADGTTAFYPLTENVHRDGILRVSTPRAHDALQALAEDYTLRVLEHLDYVGVMAFEFFVVGDELYANEIAPRVHNSGHWTMDGAVCSQFENHLRAIAGLPLGETRLRAPCAMINFIGEVPPTEQLLAIPELHLHLYGKTPKPLRKVGHANILAPDHRTLQDRVAAVERLCLS